LSTSGLPRRRALREALRAAGSTMVDCPISGIPPVLEQRKAVLMASGERTEFAEVEPYLRILSDEVFYLGEFGAGTMMKYVANYLMTVNTAAVAEAMALVKRAGLDAAAAPVILGKGASGSFQVTARGPQMAEGRYQRGHASLAALTKDLDLIGDFTASLGLDSRLFAGAAALVHKADDLGFGDYDPAALVEAVRANMRTAK
jgi:3-hydroxyisobutyrate dehydrogenase-like beta-hydroxyacid dehydrogenase